MEAERVLTKLGFVCRRAGSDPSGRAAWVLQEPDDDLEERTHRLEAEMAVVQEALASVRARVAALERTHDVVRTAPPAADS
jgi:hypothetical protein